MKLKLCFALLALAATTSVVSTADAAGGGSGAAKKSATKTIYVKDLSSSFKGRAKSTVPVDNSDVGHAPSGFNVTMKQKPGTKPARAVASTSSASSSSSASKKSATAAKPVVARASNDPVSTYARTLKASYGASGPDLALGQALAVDDSYIVTSADFVTEAWTNSGEVKFFVGDVPSALQLVAFDLGSNLAVFSVGLSARLEHTLPLARVRTDEMTTAEDYASLGGGNLLNGARRLKPVADLTFVRERFEMPAAVTFGTGVQFLFDRAGRWTGSVSLLDQREGRKYDVSSSTQVHDILAKLEQRPPAPLPPTVLRDQAQAWQDRWTTKFFEAGGALKGLECAARGVTTEDVRVVNELARTRLVQCHNAIPVALSRDYSMGVELVTGDVSYTKNVSSYLAADRSATSVFAPTATRGPASINVMSGAECEKSEVSNSHGKRVHVRFCTAALKNAPGLTDTTITTISADSGQDNGRKSSMHSLHLRGFDAKNAKRFMEWMIDTETIQ